MAVESFADEAIDMSATGHSASDGLTEGLQELAVEAVVFGGEEVWFVVGDADVEHGSGEVGLEGISWFLGGFSFNLAWLWSSFSLRRNLIRWLIRSGSIVVEVPGRDAEQLHGGDDEAVADPKYVS